MKVGLQILSAWFEDGWTLGTLRFKLGVCSSFLLQDYTRFRLKYCFVFGRGNTSVLCAIHRKKQRHYNGLILFP